MEEESELRQLWICLIYLTLEEAGLPAPADAGSTILEEVRKKYRNFVASIVQAKKQGLALKSLNIDQFREKDSPRNALEDAILAQSMRVVYLTTVVLEEERLATGDDDTYYLGKDEEPGPFIAGSK